MHGVDSQTMPVEARAVAPDGAEEKVTFSVVPLTIVAHPETEMQAATISNRILRPGDVGIAPIAAQRQQYGIGGE